MIKLLQQFCLSVCLSTSDVILANSRLERSFDISGIIDVFVRSDKLRDTCPCSIINQDDETIDSIEQAITIADSSTY